MRQLVQKSGLGADRHDSRMPTPRSCDALIDLPRLRDAFPPDPILLVAPRQRGDLNVDDCRIAAQFLFEIDTEFLKEVSA